VSKGIKIDDEKHWYKDAIIYELHIKAFFDSNGDGIGDFQGLIQKLDYLEDLGVTAIWVLPFYPSPLRDDGYDIADYYNINPSYGKLRDFKRFIREAHNRGLKVITELVINHTSDQHPWFQRARKAPPGSRHRDYYVWSDDPGKYKDVRIIFTDTEPSNWTWDPEAKAYFWHRFFSHQPDLNFDSPDVQQEVFDIMDFWCELGVDGFRLDAVPYLFEREGTNCENLPQTHEFLKKLRAHIDSKYDNKLFLAEANMWPEDSAAYFGKGDECHMNYHFPIMPRMFMALKMEDRYPIIDIIDQTPEIPPTCQWAIFLRNHDELTLEMVTDEERDYMYKVYTKDPQAKINVGIRHRLAPLLENNRSKIELMNVLLFSLPGTPVIYYGDEIGMGDNFYLGDRDGVRTPMQWTGDRNAGFSTANPHKLYLPTIIDPEYKYEAVNVESQQINSSSLLWWMKRIIGMRKRYKAFGRGNIEFLAPANAKIIAFIRAYEGEQILVLCNLSRFAQAADLELGAFEGHTPVEVFSRNRFPRIGREPYLFTLAPFGYYWLSLEQDERLVEAGPPPRLKADKWSGLMSKPLRKKLQEEVLPRYLDNADWYAGRNRIRQSLEIRNSAALPLRGLPSRWLVVKTSYNDGLPEHYQLLVAWIPEARREALRDLPDAAILAEMQLGSEPGVLIDAIYEEPFRMALLQWVRQGKRFETDGGELHFSRGKRKFPAPSDPMKSRILPSGQTFSSLQYDDRYHLKLYRRLDDTLNPDLELAHFLSEETTYEHVPDYLGAVTFSAAGRTTLALGLAQELDPSQGTAWEYTRDAFHMFFERALAAGEETKFKPPKGGLTDPLRFEDLPELLKDLMGSALPERIVQLGERTAGLHRALASQPGREGFEHEAFSLHYQRSVYSSLQGLTRDAFDKLRKSLKRLPEEIQEEAREVLGLKNDVLQCFKRIFSHKMEAVKIRTHGDFHLDQVLWTGRDFLIRNFEGEPMRPFSERRLKRSPLRDVAAMIRSLHYAVYGALHESDLLGGEGNEIQEYWAQIWNRASTRLYLSGYLKSLDGPGFIPEDPDDYRILLETFLLEKAVYELGYELEHRPDWVLIPLRGIRSVLREAGFLSS